MKGLFITFEGGEACGKSTQVALLKEYILQKQNKDMFIFTREPGGTDLGETIRDLLLHNKNVNITPRAELLLFLAARAQLYADCIRPQLDLGNVVIADRFYDSTIVYQGYARSVMPPEQILNLNLEILDNLTPDMTFYFKISPKTAMLRKGKDAELDKIESLGLDFHEKVANGYDTLIKKFPERFHVIDATKSVAEIHQEIVQALEAKIQTR